MLDKNDLQAISELMDAKLEQQTKAFDSKLERLDTKIDGKINGVYAYLENRIEPQLKLLAEGHQTLLEQLAPKSRLEDLEDEVKLLKIVIKQMNEEIQAIKAS